MLGQQVSPAERPEDAMFEAMLPGWRAQPAARGLRQDTIVPRERLVRRFAESTSEYPWNWGSSHADQWTQSLTGERHLAPSTIARLARKLEWPCGIGSGYWPPMLSVLPVTGLPE